jgi:hypothetical protein
LIKLWHVKVGGWFGVLVFGVHDALACITRTDRLVSRAVICATKESALK